mgnify:CR=1 FL=1
MFDLTVDPANAKYLSLKVTHHISAFSNALGELIKIVLVPSCRSFLLKAKPFHFCLNLATLAKSSKASL